MRDIEKALCSCGGLVVKKDTTEEEEKEHGCGRSRGCCCRALQCEKCGVRFTLALEAPEYMD